MSTAKTTNSPDGHAESGIEPGPEAPLVVAVVLQWNRARLTERALAALEAQDYPNLRILVVDNGSSDDSVERIRTRFPDVPVLETGKNLGFAAGNNLGIEKALEQGSEFVWILNNDTRPTDRALSEMVARGLEDKRIAAIGSVLVDDDDGQAVQAFGSGRVNLWTGLPSHHRRPTPLGRNSYLTGASLLLRSAALAEVGPFDEGFRFYWEDVDLCFRLRAAGWLLAVASRSVVRHESYGSMAFTSPERDELFTRSSFRFLWRWARLPSIPILVSTTGRWLRRAISGRVHNAAAVWRAACNRAEPDNGLPAGGNNAGWRSVVILDPGNFTPLYDLHLAAALAEIGWQVRWVTSRHLWEMYRPPDPIEIAEQFFTHLERLAQRVPWAKTSTLARRLLKVLLYPLDLARFHARVRKALPGVLHVQWALMPWLDASVWARLRRVGWTVVYTVHDVVPLTGTTPAPLGWGQRRLLLEADHLIIHTETAAAKVRQRRPGRSGIHVLPMGPTVPLEDARLPRGEARARLALSEAGPVLLFFGFVKPYKGLEILLESLESVRRSHADVLLLVAGEVLGSRVAYDRIVQRLHLADHVRWTDGFVASEHVPLYFRAADAVVLPYLSASTSAVLTTARYFGTPIVASSVASLVEQLGEDGSANLVPSGDPVALAEELIKVLTRAPNAASIEREDAGREDEGLWREIARATSSIYGTRSGEPVQNGRRAET